MPQALVKFHPLNKEMLLLIDWLIVHLKIKSKKKRKKEKRFTFKNFLHLSLFAFNNFFGECALLSKCKNIIAYSFLMILAEL